MIRNILLDLDDTILDFHRAERFALSRMLREVGIEPTEEILTLYHAINEEHWKRLERGEITRREVKVGRYEELFRELGVAFGAAEATAVYEGFLAQGGFLLPGAEELLRELSAAYRLYAVSNGTARVQQGRIARTGIAGYFRRIFISELIGYDKPTREFFTSCFREIEDFHTEETVLVGDSLTADIRGGIHMGIPTIWYNPQHQENAGDIRPDFEADRLDAIPALICEIACRKAPISAPSRRQAAQDAEEADG